LLIFIPKTKRTSENSKNNYFLLVNAVNLATNLYFCSDFLGIYQSFLGNLPFLYKIR